MTEGGNTTGGGYGEIYFCLVQEEYSRCKAPEMTGQHTMEALRRHHMVLMMGQWNEGQGEVGRSMHINIGPTAHGACTKDSQMVGGNEGGRLTLKNVGFQGAPWLGRG